MRSEIAQIIKKHHVLELIYGDTANPKQLLGRHMVENGQVIASYHPDAIGMQLINEEGEIYDMDYVERHPIFAIFFPTKVEFPYQIKMMFKDGNTYTAEDPYSFSGQITPEEEELFLRGKWTSCYEKLGARPMTLRGVEGVYFAVWAPNAKRVSVVGEFNYWNGLQYPMQRLDDSGIFEIFIPGIPEKTSYKYEIKTKDGQILKRVDPFGLKDLNQKNNTSIILDMKKMHWNDQHWMKDRRQKKWNDLPFVVSDSEFLDNNQIELQKEGCITHVLLKVPDFTHGLRGKIREWINSLHERGVGVLLQISLGWFFPEENGLKDYDGMPIYEYGEKELSFVRKGDRIPFNHSRPEVVSYLLSYLIFWIRFYHVDGFVFEGVSEMLDFTFFSKDRSQTEKGEIYRRAAEEFLRKAVHEIKKEDFSVLVFTDEKKEKNLPYTELLYSKAPFDGTLNYSIFANVNEYLQVGIEKPGTDFYKLSLPLMKHGIKNTILDMVPDRMDCLQDAHIHQRNWNDYERISWKKLTMGYLMGVPGKKRWSWHFMQTAEIRNYIKALLHIYADHACMYIREPRKPSFVWMNGMDAKNAVLTFVRQSPGYGKNLLFICNFDRNRKEGYSIGVPKFGEYKLILNSDWACFGGSSRMDEVILDANSMEWDLQPYSLRVMVPGLSVLIFEY